MYLEDLILDLIHHEPEIVKYVIHLPGFEQLAAIDHLEDFFQSLDCVIMLILFVKFECLVKYLKLKDYLFLLLMARRVEIR